MMNQSNIEVSLQRAEELFDELRREYKANLHAQVVSERATQLTHEVFERLRSVLDRIARRYWEIHVSAHISEDEKARANVYFPISQNQHEFDSTLGRWRWKGVREKFDDFYEWLKALQPFSDPNNTWLLTLSSLAIQGKHIDLVPQKKIESRRVTVTGPTGGSVSWGSGVTFGSGVSVMGAPIDPRTQRIVPTAGVDEKVEVWVSFLIDGYDIDSLQFCREAITKTRGIVEEMTRKFNL